MKVIFVWGLLLIPFLGISQRWKTLLEVDNANFYDVQQAFYDDLPHQNEYRQYGYKHFKRLEHFLEDRVYPSGEIKQYSLDNRFQNRSNNRSDHWMPLGPDTWSNLSEGYNPGNGRVNSIAVHPTNAQIIYVATSGGGIWKTTNGGTNWLPLTDELPILETSDIVIDPVNPSVIIFATGDNNSFRKSIGLYRSTDAGATWTLTQPFSDASNTKVGFIEMDPNNSNLIYCSTNNGMYRSLDNGVTWLKLNSTPLYNIRLKPSDPSIIYATNGSDISKSIDSGQTFLPMIGFPISGSSRIELNTSVQHPNYVYALTAKGNKSFGGVCLSKDGGTTWKVMSTTPNILDNTSNGGGVGGQGDYDLALEVNPNNPAEIIVGGINVWKSVDTGKTWINLSHWYLPFVTTNEYTHADIHYLKYYGSSLFCGSDGGIFKSNDLGYTWLNLSQGLEITEVYDFDIYKPNASILTLGSQDNGTFKHNSSWTNVFGADGFKSLIDQSNANHFIFSTQNGSFYKTLDGGISNTTIFGQSTSLEAAAWETPILASDELDTILVGHMNLWLSKDSGNNFVKVTTSLTNSSIKVLARSKSNPSIVYAADANELFKLDVNFTTGFATKTDVTLGLPIGQASISDVLVHPNDENTVWVTFSGTSGLNKVYKTTNGGFLWTNETGVLPNVPVNCIAYSEQNSGLYIGLDGGVYYKDNLNPVWTSYFNGMPNTVVTKILVDEIGGKVYASTFGRGIWESNGFYISGAGIFEEKKSSDVTVFPNPANDQINIQFTQEDNVELKILDIAGKVVLYQNKIFSGATIDVTTLESGTYVVILKSQERIISEQFLKR